MMEKMVKEVVDAVKLIIEKTGWDLMIMTDEENGDEIIGMFLGTSKLIQAADSAMGLSDDSFDPPSSGDLN